MNRTELNKYLVNRGFRITSTGGNCEAWVQDWDDERNYCYITDVGSASLPIDADDMFIGLFVDDNMIGSFEGNLADVMHYWEYISKEDYQEYIESTDDKVIGRA